MTKDEIQAALDALGVLSSIAHFNLHGSVETAQLHCVETIRATLQAALGGAGVPDEDFSMVDHGLYKIFWKEGGWSYASAGSTQSGERWYAPTNWTSVPGYNWSLVERVELIASRAKTAPKPVTLNHDLNNIRRLVNEQAEDPGLWFDAKYASEAYLQQELRKLHMVIEGENYDGL